MNALVKAWYNRNTLLYILAPFAFCYSLAARFKKFCYSLGLKKTYHFPVPIIVVGNITVGGTGKTPLVIALAQFFQKQGFKPGIVSRGYRGRANKKPFAVMADSDPVAVGDEPLLIKRATGCPVVIARSRVAAVQTLLQNSNCDLILSDDGLQHYALGRDIEIVVVDGERCFGNGLCLPAGPLRESKNRLRSVDWVVVQGEKKQPGVYMQLVAGEIYNLQDPKQELAISAIKQPIHAVAGIGNPQRFFKQLRSLGLSVIEHAFPDHHHYRRQDFNFLEEGGIVIMTEKDAIKCTGFMDARYWCLPVTAKCELEFLEDLLAQVKYFSKIAAFIPPKKGDGGL